MLSRSNPPGRAAAVFTGLAVALVLGCQGTRSELPPIHLNPNMDFQQKFEAQEVNEWFEDGRAMRKPPAGTIARGHLKSDKALHYGFGPDGKLIDHLPASIELDRRLLDRGHERYDIYCAPCHGSNGRGRGMATRRGGGMAVAPASFHQKRLLGAPLGWFYHVIAYGRGTMLPYASQIPVVDRWAIAAWVRVLQRHGQRMGWDDTPAADGTALARGDGQAPGGTGGTGAPTEPAPTPGSAEATPSHGDHQHG